MVDLRTLEAFVWVARLAQFRAAATKLHVTQPAISTRIAALEETLGVRLFERKSNKAALTAKGKELLLYAERMLELREAIRVAADRSVAVQGEFRLGVSDTLVYTWFPRFVERIHEAFPLLTLEIHVDVKPNMLRALGARELDIAFVTEPINEPGLRKLVLSSYDLAWIASASLKLPRSPVPLAVVAERPIITYVRNSRVYDLVQDTLASAGVSGRIYSSASMSATVTMISRGIAIGAIPPAVVHRELRAGSMRILEVENAPLPELAFVAVYPRGPENAVAASVAELARQAAMEHQSVPKRRAKRGGS